MDPIKSEVNEKFWELKEYENSCRKFNLDNLDHYHKFPRQTRDPRLAMFNDDEIFLMKMKVAGKENLMTRNFSSSVIKEFNGYEVIKHELAHEEKKFIPIDIVFEPRYNESFPVLYLSTDEIYLAHRSYIGKMVR